MINRKQMAKKAGISYDLLRHYERSLSNVLNLSKGSNHQILFNDRAQGIILEAISLKQNNGYSMKQLVQHFNDSSRVDGDATRFFTDKAKKAPHTAKDVFEDAAFHDEKGPEPFENDPSSLPAIRQTTPQTTPAIVPTVQEISSAVSLAVSSEIMENLGAGIGRQVATALSTHLANYDANLAMLTQAMHEISSQNQNISKTSQILLEDNSKLRTHCDELSHRLSALEDSVNEERENTLGKRFMNWFFGVKKNNGSKQPQSQGSLKNQVTQANGDTFAGYFRRFLKDPVARDKDACKDIHSVRCFSKS